MPSKVADFTFGFHFPHRHTMRDGELNDQEGMDTVSTDHSLIRRFRSGEQDAATQLYLRYAARLQALASSQTSPTLASRFDPEDVVQSVFRTFFRRASQGLYDVPPGEELWQLLLVIALNKIRELAAFHRAQKRDVGKTHGSQTLEDYRHASHTDDETSLRIFQMVLDDLLGEMPATRRAIIEMRIEGYQVEEIARRAERSKRTVERILRDFRQKLSDLIDVKPDQHNERQSESST